MCLSGNSEKQTFTRLLLLVYIVWSLLAIATTKAKVAETAFLFLERQTSTVVI